jgi:hypothetical protein
MSPLPLSPRSPSLSIKPVLSTPCAAAPRTDPLHATAACVQPRDPPSSSAALLELCWCLAAAVEERRGEGQRQICS